MKKIVEKLKNSKKLILGILIGALTINLIEFVVSLAANSVSSDIVLYDSSTGKTNVKDAIDELYTMASTHCPDNDSCLNNRKLGSSNITYVPTTYLAIVYLDPTDLNKSCNASNSFSTTGRKTGCMKWYAYRDNGDTYDLILDHNTTAKVNSFSAAQTQISTDTSSWVSSLNPRNITADEIAKITGNTSFNQATSNGNAWFYFDSNSQTQTAKSQGASKYSWLFDYIYSCTSYGCNIADSSNYGYWTQNTMAGSSSYAWYVHYIGGLYSGDVSYPGFGVRPVITISKS